MLKIPRHFVFDVESDGPHPLKYNMIEFGIVSVEYPEKRFHGKCSPLHMNDGGIKEARAVCGISWEEQQTFDSIFKVMTETDEFLANICKSSRPIMWSDNPAYDWQFLNTYFHEALGVNPCGHSARRIGDYYAGTVRNIFAQSRWKKLRKTRHTHNPVDDALGNVEALRIILGKDNA